MSAAKPKLDRDQVKNTDPLLLRVAAALAYPDGSMTAIGLRKMADRGLLDIEETCGRHYTTLANIEEMRRRCRVQRKAPASTSASGRDDLPSGRSEDLARTSAQAALSMTVKGLQERLKKSSRKDIGRTAEVVPLRS